MRAQEHIQQSQFQPLVGVDPLQTTWLERGAVRSRVALLLRSSETQPLFNDLSSIDRTCPQASDQSPGATCSRGCLICSHRLRFKGPQVLHHCSRGCCVYTQEIANPSWSILCESIALGLMQVPQEGSRSCSRGCRYLATRRPLRIGTNYRGRPLPRAARQ